MKSKVYAVNIKDADDIRTVNDRLKVLLANSKVFDILGTNQRVAVKAHFGEEGNTGFVRPDHVRVICDEIHRKGAVPLLSDANTLYRGRRLNSKDHLALAHEHGFTKEALGVDIFIPDDGKKEDAADIQIGQRLIKTAKVARFYIDVDAIVAVSHFKGHVLTSFGGAIKNIGMGCATREGKLAQHCDAAPVFHAENCVGCGECELVCPAGAIHIENDKSVLDRSKCIGCASCVAACPHMAMFIDFDAGNELQQKMAEYALAVLGSKKDKACFLNFAIRITRECDCWPFENPGMAPDVGILASLDPVSIDKASLDLVNDACGKDVFREAHPQQDPLRQLKHAEEIGLGSMEYEIIQV
jgi:uncharacterized protein